MARKCPECGYERLPTDYGCPNCEAIYAEVEAVLNENTDSESKPQKAEGTPKIEGSSNIKLLFGLIGSIALFIGVFTPIVSVPVVGNMNYFQNGKGDGVIILILAVISLILVLLKKYKGLWFTGIANLGVLLFTFINFQSKMSQAKADMASKLAGNPFRGLADMAIQSVQLQWGWALLIAGVALVIASAAMKDSY